MLSIKAFVHFDDAEFKAQTVKRSCLYFRLWILPNGNAVADVNDLLLLRVYLSGV